MLESALTTIVDLEDSIAAVDAEDKVAAYANWLGLMKGDLAGDASTRAASTMTRRAGADRGYTRPTADADAAGPQPAVRAQRRASDDDAGGAAGRRQRGARGHPRRDRHQHDRAVRPARARQVPQQPRGHRSISSSPRCTGRTRCAFTNRLFDAVEDLLGLARHTIKVGRDGRGAADLGQPRRLHPAVKDRIVFINTGFLDRTGDEMHTAMRAGPMIPKARDEGERLDQGL